MNSTQPHLIHMTSKQSAHPAMTDANVPDSDTADLDYVQSTPSTEPKTQGPSRASLRKSALDEGPERDRWYAKHPFTNNELQIATPQVKAVYDRIVTAIIHRTPGTVFVGEWRAGKTFATEMVVRQLANTFPELPTGLVVARGSKTPSRGGWTTMVLNGLKHAGSGSGRVAKLEDRLVKTLAAMAKRTDSKAFLLFIDEGQEWHEEEYAYLRDAINLLRSDEHITLITVIFASEAIQAVKDKFLSDRRGDLVMRFMRTLNRFDGISSEAEMAEIFAALDDPLKHSFPEGSGLATSEFYAPGPFRDGWRLAHHAKIAWGAFSSVASRHRKTVTSLGMTWVMAAVQHVLFTAAADPQRLLTHAEELWAAGVHLSEFEDFVLVS